MFFAIVTMIWVFIFIFIALWVYMGIELYLYFRPSKTPDDWDSLSEWEWRRRVRKAIDDLLKE